MTITVETDISLARGALLRLLSPPGPEDPYPDYAVLRSHAPVYLSDFGVCFVSSYAGCEVLLGSQDFAVQDVTWYDANIPGWRARPATRTLYQGVQSRNPPEHTRMRRVLGGCFSARRMAGLRGLVGTLADKYLDVLADAGADGSVVDLMSVLAVPLPYAVVSELLGVPESDRAEFHGLAGRIFDLMDLIVSDEDRMTADEATRKLRTYWTELVAERRRMPREDLTSELVAAADAGQLSQEELMSTLVFLFAAGYGTTAALIGNATAALLAEPAIADQLRADPAFASAVVEESLRHESPSQIDPRLAMRDTRLGGIQLAAGQFVLALLGAGNRDPSRFPDPDRFDPARPGTRVLSFGGGIHYCLGAPLSRMEASVVLPRLVRRFPRMAYSSTPVRRRALRMRSFAHLPLTLS